MSYLRDTTWCKLFQKRVAYTKFNIYVLIKWTIKQTNEGRKNKACVLFHLPHKSLILKVITRYIHVAYHVHIEKCLQSVETLECRNRREIVSMLTTSEVDSVFEPQSGQTKDMYCFSTKHTALRSKNKDCLVQS